MVYDINSSVGKRCANNKSDVKLVQALLNVYCRKKTISPIKISGVVDDLFVSYLLKYQKEHLKILKSKERIDPKSKVIKSLNEILKGVFTPLATSEPKFGTLTWYAEGTEGGLYHSRKLHVPSSSSGLTIGRGYDLREKRTSRVRKDLASSGINPEDISILVNAIGLKGNRARQFIVDNDLLDYQITIESQKKLFKVSYEYEASEVRRICLKADVKEIYGITDWEKLNQIIRAVVIDLKFRGDYSPEVRKFLQRTIAKNDLNGFYEIISNRTLWVKVPKDRFNRRVNYIKQNI